MLSIMLSQILLLITFSYIIGLPECFFIDITAFSGALWRPTRANRRLTSERKLKKILCE